MSNNDNPAGSTGSNGNENSAGDFTRRGLMALGSVAGLGLASAGMTSAGTRGSGSASRQGNYSARATNNVASYTVGPHADFDNIQDAVDNLPEDTIQHADDENDLNHKVGHVHVLPDYDYSNESSWPITIEGNVALTTDARRGATIAPPDNKIGIEYRSAADDDAGWQTNKQQPYISGFRMVARDFLGDVSGSKPEGFIHIRGGTGVVVDQCDMTRSRSFGIKVDNALYDFNGDGTREKELWAIHTTIRNCVLRQCGDYNVWQANGENNSLHCVNVLSRDANEHAYRFGTNSAPTTVNMLGCTAEKSGGSAEIMVEGIRNFNMWGCYSEGSNTRPVVVLKALDAKPTADIRGLYVNGANYVVIAKKTNTVSVSHVSYYDVSEAVVAQTYPSSNARVEPSTCRVCCGGTEVPAYYTDPNYPSDKRTLRADGDLVKQDLTSTGATGFYDGDRAVHDGSGSNRQGVYVWDESAGQWVGPSDTITP